MVCKEISTNLYYNYTFINSNNKLVKIWNNETSSTIDYLIWCKDFYIIDKWRNIREDEIDENYKNKLKINN